MSKKPFYRQCTLVSKSDTGELRQVAWIPEQFAVVGRELYFGKKTTTPDRIWTVLSAPEGRISEEYLVERERDHLHQREASDI